MPHPRRADHTTWVVSWSGCGLHDNTHTLLVPDRCEASQATNLEPRSDGPTAGLSDSIRQMNLSDCRTGAQDSSPERSTRRKNCQIRRCILVST